MAAQSPPFALQNASHGAAVFRQAAFSPWTTSGPLGAAELAVAAQSTPNMSVQVSAGRAWIAGTQVANASGQTWSTQAGYFGINDAPLSVTITTANATNPRIDVIYAAVNDSFYSGSLNTTVIGVATGTAAASPVAPAIPSNAIALATVAVAANATSIVAGNIAATAPLLALTSPSLRLTGTGNASPTTDGPLVIGPTTGLNVTIDQNELVPRNNGALSSFGVGGGRITSLGTPTSGGDATTKGYVDGRTAVPLCQVKQDTTQIIPLSTWTTVTFDNETVDTDGMHSTSTNNSRVTCTAAGYYTVTGTVPFLNPPGTSTVRVGSRLLKNGTAIDFGSAYVTVQAPLNGCAAETPTAIIQLAVGDYIELQAWQDFTSTGGGLNTRIASDQRAALSVACARLI